jgi:hypothetical protein
VKLKILATMILIVTVLGCKSESKKEAEAEAKPGWPGEMQGLAENVKDLLPFLYNRAAYQDPKNHDVVLNRLKEFAQSANHVQPDMGKRYLGDDLLVEFALGNLSSDLQRAEKSFEAGQTEYSRSVAKASLSYCFQCHSVTHEGAKAAWNTSQLDSLNLDPIEKAELLVATRRYDKALAHMEGLLNSPEFFKDHAFELESLLRRYLALIIRVEKAPERALHQLSKIEKRPDTPHYISEQIEGWETSLKAWRTERPRTIKNAKTLFEQVEKRFQKAASLQHFEKDHAGDVEFLRATEQLHQGLKLIKTPSDEARAMFLLGRAYEVLDELGSWNLHETYYEACIKKDAHSPVAKNCYSRLEASLYMGYSGSSGTHLPSEESDRLKRLRDLM